MCSCLELEIEQVNFLLSESFRIGFYRQLGVVELLALDGTGPKCHDQAVAV